MIRALRILLTLVTLLPLARGATINYDVNTSSSGNYTGTAVASDSGTLWNSAVITSTTTNLMLVNVTDSFGNATGISISITNTAGTVINRYSDATAGNGDPNPVALMQDYTFSGTYLVTVSGLASGTYSLYAFAHGNAANQNGTITLNAANGGAGGTEGSTGTEYRNIFTAGAQGYSYLKLNGTASGTGVFSFTVGNYLNGFQLQLITTPGISGLTNQTAVSGTTATLSPTIVGTAPFSYQWFSNSIVLAGQTNAALVLNNVQYAQNGTAYSLAVTNPAGMVTNTMTLTVLVPPSIVGLNNQAVQTGNTVNIAPSVSGVPTPTLYWQFNGITLTNGLDGNGSTISGGATSSLGIANVQAADTGTYSLIASNSAGVMTSSMTLTVSAGNVAPGITGPANQTVVQTSNATFSASVSGLPVPSLQWLVNGAVLSSATNATLAVSNVQYSQNGFVYSLVASNSAGTGTNSATLFVLVPPTVSQQPSNQTVVTGDSATFRVTAGGVPAVFYQWNWNGSPIAIATNASYSVTNALGAINGAVYSVTVSNSVGVVTSDNATLTVLSTMSGTFLPTNGAGNISPDEPLRIVFSDNMPQLNSNGVFTVRDAADNSAVQTIDASHFLSYTPGNTSIQTIPNAAIRTVQGSYSGTGTGSTTYYYMPIALYGSDAWITLTNRLSYGHTYYVTCDPGLFLDSSNASFAGITGTNTWVFSTKPAGPATPTAATGPTTISIGLDGAGDFASFQGAFDWVPQSNTLARTVHVLPGIYRDSATLAGGRNYVTIVGDGASRTNTQLIYPFAYFAPPNPVFTAGSLRIESSDVAVENLTLDNIIYNAYHPTGNPASGAPTNFAGAINTLATSGNQIVFDNVLVKGGQDTVYNIQGIIYYNNCEVWGSVDFIYGAALAVFDQCNIVEIRSSGGPCTAPDTAYAQPYGINFLGCTFPQAFVTNGYPYDVGAATTTFMRPWGKDGMTASINCAIGDQFNTEGYQTFGNTNEDECRAREYGTTMIGGTAPTIAQRQAAGAYWVDTIDPDYTNASMLPTDPLLAPPPGTNNRVAVIIDPNDYTLSAIFGSSYFNLNGWLPAVLPTITLQPANQIINIGSTVTFTVAAAGLPSPTFQWLENGTNVSGATNATLVITNAQTESVATYSVIVSNSAGGVLSSNAIFAMSNIAPGINGLTSQTVIQGSNAMFTTSIAGLPQPTLQWYVNGTNIAGATESSLTVTDVQYSLNGYVYSLVASNSDGVATSGANLYVLVPPTIAVQPANLVVSNTLAATFEVTVAGVPAVAYQWYFNNNVVSAATASNYVISAVSPVNSGNYYVIATNSAGAVTSTVVLLTVTSAPGPVPLPAINVNNMIVVTNASYGAVGDGVSTNTIAIQNAINAATAGGKTNGLYGGTVEIPSGTYLCGPLTLKNNVNLQIDAGAILRMLPFGQYPMTWYTNNATNVYFLVSANFLSGNNLTNIEISGFGAIDGQGSPWWPWAYTNNAVRPIMISLVGCNRELIQNVTLSNSPEFHIAVSFGANTTVQYVTEQAPSSSDPANPSHNTDACDISGTNTLVQFNNISVGDDNFACSGRTANVVISNNVYGNGHGTSIGSYTSPSVSNLWVINCTYSNTQTGAHIKSDRDRGGFVHNINYFNLTMTNALHPIQIYCQYTNTTIPSLDSISPAVAAAYPTAAVTATTPMYRDITISNFTASAESGRAAGLIWGLPENSISNVTLVDVNLTGSKTFGIYDAKNVQIIDSSYVVPAGVSQYAFYDASVTFSNSTPSASVVTLDGATTNSVANAFSFYNCMMTLAQTNALALNSAITLGASTLIISNNLALTASNSLNFFLGTNVAMLVVKGNLMLGGTNNIFAGNGFTNGTYTLITYTGSLAGNIPVLGSTPAGYACRLNTNSTGQVNLTVLPPPGIPANLTAFGTNLLINVNWFAASNSTGYNLLRSTTNGGPYGALFRLSATNYSDAITNPGMVYYYVVVATNTAGVSGYSSQAMATALPSLVATNLAVQISDNQLMFSWPSDHSGWHLEVQTNSFGAGLGTNWFPVAGSTLSNQISILINPANEDVFYRLAY